MPNEPERVKFVRKNIAAQKPELNLCPTDKGTESKRCFATRHRFHPDKYGYKKNDGALFIEMTNTCEMLENQQGPRQDQPAPQDQPQDQPQEAPWRVPLTPQEEETQHESDLMHDALERKLSSDHDAFTRTNRDKSWFSGYAQHRSDLISDHAERSTTIYARYKRNRAAASSVEEANRCTQSILKEELAIGHQLVREVETLVVDYLEEEQSQVRDNAAEEAERTENEAYNRFWKHYGTRRWFPNFEAKRAQIIDTFYAKKDALHATYQREHDSTAMSGRVRRTELYVRDDLALYKAMVDDVKALRDRYHAVEQIWLESVNATKELKRQETAEYREFERSNGKKKWFHNFFMEYEKLVNSMDARDLNKIATEKPDDPDHAGALRISVISLYRQINADARALRARYAAAKENRPGFFSRMFKKQAGGALSGSPVAAGALVLVTLANAVILSVGSA